MCVCLWHTHRGENVDMVFTSVLGHLMELDFVQPFRSWGGCRPGDLFTAPVEKRVRGRGCAWVGMYMYTYVCNMRKSRPGGSHSPADSLTPPPPPPQVGKGKESLAKTLRQEARGCQRLVLWLDCDLEGENIAHEVMQVCLEGNPRCVVLVSLCVDGWRTGGH